jgi:hypothetical protein
MSGFLCEVVSDSYHLFEITGFLGAGIFGLRKAEGDEAIRR